MPTPIKIKVSLQDMPHEVSRKILVPQDINMMQLHYVIQLAMGWTFSHLFQFSDKKIHASIIASFATGEEYIIDVEDTPANQVKLKNEFLEKREGKPFWYWYDFGDDWWHKITFLKPGKKDLQLFKGAPKCVEATGVCPPENVGGTYGYSEFLEAVNNPKHPGYENYRLWAKIPLGVEYNTEYINLELVNAYLTGYFFSPDWKLTAHQFLRSSPTPFLENLLL